MTYYDMFTVLYCNILNRPSCVCLNDFTLLDLCVSSLRRGHANLLCIVHCLTGNPRRESFCLFKCCCFCASPASMAAGSWKRAPGRCYITPGLHDKIPAHKIFARVWVAQEPIVYIINAKIFQGLGPKRRESCNGDRVYSS